MALAFVVSIRITLRRALPSRFHLSSTGGALPEQSFVTHAAPSIISFSSLSPWLRFFFGSRHFALRLSVASLVTCTPHLYGSRVRCCAFHRGPFRIYRNASIASINIFRFASSALIALLPSLPSSSSIARYPAHPSSFSVAFKCDFTSVPSLPPCFPSPADTSISSINIRPGYYRRVFSPNFPDGFSPADCFFISRFSCLFVFFPRKRSAKKKGFLILVPP